MLMEKTGLLPGMFDDCDIGRTLRAFDAGLVKQARTYLKMLFDPTEAKKMTKEQKQAADWLAGRLKETGLDILGRELPHAR